MRCRYANVVPQCLVDSPTARWWFDWEASGGKPDDLIMHIEKNADFDGLAVGWGIGNKKASVEECGEACRAHRRNPQGGEYGCIARGMVSTCSTNVLSPVPVLARFVCETGYQLKP